MPQENFVKLSCQTCKAQNYWVHKNKKAAAEKKLALKKYCAHCKKHTPHKESK